MWTMSEQDGGQQDDLANLPGVGSAFGYDPGAELKKKGLPWPAYIAIGIAASALLGFLFFRASDIVKPYPANKLEDLHGGIGIMADDAMAGVYANLALRAALMIAAAMHWTL